MADLRTNLIRLSERGHPVGAEEMIERIEADLAGDPLVIVNQRREGALVTKTQPSPTTGKPSPSRTPVWWALAAVVAVLAGASIYIASNSPGSNEVANTEPPPTTLDSEAQAQADLEAIEAGVAAYYSGDADRAVELFELSDRTDQEIRDDSAYQAIVNGRLTVNCTGVQDGVFSCRVPYDNAMTDAIGSVDHGDVNQVTVEDGVITQFGFPEHSWLMLNFGTFLASQGRFEGYDHCAFGPFTQTCGTLQMENLDGWVEWRRTIDRPSVVGLALESWYEGDCKQATFLSFTDVLDGVTSDACPSAPDQPAPSPIRMMDYEHILGADVSVDNCETLESTADRAVLRCDVSYSNEMSSAVGKAPAVTTREFGVYIQSVLVDGDDESAWYKADYPEDTELRDSFRRFAEATTGLSAEYEEAGCATNRTETCANLIVDNLDDWATWYQNNG